MENITIKPQTVILFVGPTGCGKTFFAENVLIPELLKKNRFINKKLNVQHLSSDNFRREMTGYNPYMPHTSNYPSKHGNGMDYVSEQAFLMLKTKLAAVISYPVNADFVIVDTTGMSQEFRKEVTNITLKANYNLHLMVFEYKNRDDYYKYVEADPFQRKETSDSIKRFKDKLFELTKKDYPVQTKIKSIDFSETKIEIENFDKYSEYFLDPMLDYLIIGDVHGCFDELKELLCANGFIFDDNNFVVEIGLSKDGNPMKIIFIGDIIDKGEQIAYTVRFVHYLVTEGYAHMVRGNHENFVYNYLKGVKPYTELTPEFIESFIQSVEILNNDDNLKEMFFNLFDISKDFYAAPRFLVNHAPCRIEYLGKVRNFCLKNQRNFRFPRRSEFATEELFVENTEKEMAFMREESRYNNPYQIVGHVMLQNVVQFNNKLMIDTGCVAGGKLTSVEIGRIGAPRFKSVKSKRQPTGEIFPIFTGHKKIELSELDPKEQTRIKYLCLDKVNFISGTMAPADKDQSINELESLNQAIKYYKDAGVKRLILEPKHMGSRANVYLFKDVSKSYIVTRNGYKIKESTMEFVMPVLEKLSERIFKAVRPDENVKMILLDAEILPWDLLGSGLIRQHFKPVAIAAKSESELLMEHGFEDVLNALKEKDEFTQYIEDRKTLKKDVLTEKYGHTKERTFRNLYEYKHLDLHQELACVNEFQDQLLTHAGEDKEIDIQPFAILKIVFDDDTEHLFEKESNIEMYKMISDQPYAILDFEYNETTRIKYPHIFKDVADKEYMVSVHISHNEEKTSGNTAEGFYKHITDVFNMEGIVIKPETVYTPGIAPYIKVRNEKYLTIVYGHNYKFQPKFEKLICKKGVKRKLQTSIKEYELGMKMLRVPYKDVTVENEAYKQLLAEMIVEVEKEKQLDPRL